MKKAFRIFAALTMLTVYLATTVNASVVSLMCRCPHHHATASHAHCVHSHDSAHAGCKCPVDGFAFADGCDCNHDHSASVSPYIQPRTSNDDDSTRNTAPIISQALSPSTLRPLPPAASRHVYDDFRTPRICDMLARGLSLRAPPASI